MLLLLPGSALEGGPQDIAALLYPTLHASLPDGAFSNASPGVLVVGFNPVRFLGLIS